MNKIASLIAIAMIQTSDKDGNRTDVAPGSEFTPSSAAEREYLLSKGVAREKTDADVKGKKGAEVAKEIPAGPDGYAPGTVSQSGVISDPNDPNNPDPFGDANANATADAEKPEKSGSTKTK